MTSYVGFTSIGLSARMPVRPQNRDRDPVIVVTASLLLASAKMTYVTSKLTLSAADRLPRVHVTVITWMESGWMRFATILVLSSSPDGVLSWNVRHGIWGL